MSALRDALKKRPLLPDEEPSQAAPGTALHSAVAAMMEGLSYEAAKLAATAEISHHAAMEQLIPAVAEALRYATPVGMALDGRASRWLCRIRLFKDGASEPEADTDPDIPADRPGTLVIAGLPGVAAEVSKLARDFHDSPCIGLDMETLRHRLKSLRPTLSRRRGEAVWRIPYQAPGGVNMLARVDIERFKGEDHVI